MHVPNAANGLIKPQTLAAMRAGLAARAGPRGGLRRLEHAAARAARRHGLVVRPRREGRLREERAGFWDEAELGVVPGLRDLGYADAFRALHGYASREPSWAMAPRRAAGGSTTSSARAALEPAAARLPPRLAAARG